MSDAFEVVSTQSDIKCGECGENCNEDGSVKAVLDPSVKQARIDTKPEQ